MLPAQAQLLHLPQRANAMAFNLSRNYVVCEVSGINTSNLVFQSDTDYQEILSSKAIELGASRARLLRCFSESSNLTGQSGLLDAMATHARGPIHVFCSMCPSHRGLLYTRQHRRKAISAWTQTSPLHLTTVMTFSCTSLVSTTCQQPFISLAGFRCID